MINLRKPLASMVAAGVLALGSTGVLAATGDQVINFDTTNIPNINPDYQFTYDEFGISPQGPQTVTQTDSNNNGVLDNGDAFSELALFFTNSFSYLDTGLFPQPGIQNTWQILTGVSLSGFVAWDGAIGTSNLIVTFTSSTGGSMTAQNLGDPTVTEIAALDLDVGTCVITAPTSAAQGTCELTFNFNPTIAGVFDAQGKGDLFGNPNSQLNVDINVNNLSGLSAFFPGYGETCGVGELPELCTQTLTLNHDGSAVHSVPAPGSLALLGLGLLGLTRLRSRKTA